MTDTDTTADIVEITIRNEHHQPVGERNDWYAQLQVRLYDDNCTASIIVADVHSSEQGTCRQSEWSGSTLLWTSYRTGAGVVDLDSLKTLAEKLQPLLQVVADNREIDFVNGSWRSRLLSPEAHEAESDIGILVDGWTWQDEAWTVWHSVDWVYKCWEDTAKHLKLTADSREEDLVVAAIQLAKDAEADQVILVEPERAVDWLVEKLGGKRDEEEGE